MSYLVPTLRCLLSAGPVGYGPHVLHVATHEYRPWSYSHLCVPGVPVPSGYRSRPREDGRRNCGARHLHTAYPSSIAEICYPHHPFFGQTVEILRWLRRQTSDSVVIKLPDGLQIAIPAWMLDPLACQHVSEAREPRLSVDALIALRDLLDQHPLLPATSIAIPGAPQLKGDSDAHQASISPPLTEPAPLREPHRVAAAARPPASPMSRAAHPAARPGDARRVEPGA